MSVLRTGHAINVRGRSYDHFTTQDTANTLTVFHCRSICIQAQPMPCAAIDPGPGAPVVFADLTGASWILAADDGTLPGTP